VTRKRPASPCEASGCQLLVGLRIGKTPVVCGFCAMRYSDNRLQWWYSVIFASTANHRDQHYRLSEHLKFPVTSEIRAGLPLGGFACEADNHAFGCHYSERNDGRTRANSRGTASVHE